jgi:hypothetical protein
MTKKRPGEMGLNLTETMWSYGLGNGRNYV